MAELMFFAQGCPKTSFAELQSSYWYVTIKVHLVRCFTAVPELYMPTQVQEGFGPMHDLVQHNLMQATST